jgi:hypothetical protein
MQRSWPGSFHVHLAPDCTSSVFTVSNILIGGIAQDRVPVTRRASRALLITGGLMIRDQITCVLREDRILKLVAGIRLANVPTI